MKNPNEDIYLEVYNIENLCNKSASVSELSFSSNSGSRTQLLSKDFDAPLNAEYAKFHGKYAISSSDSSSYPQATIVLFYLEIFFGCITFSIVIPTLWPYLQLFGDTDEAYLGICIAVYSFGSLVGSLMIGSLYNSLGPKASLLLSIFIGFVGAFLHFIAVCVGSWAILAGRFFTGFMIGGQMTVENSYIGENVPENIRTQILGRMQLFACLGFIFGPLAALPFDLEEWEFDLLSILPLNYMTLPGLCMSVLCILLFIAVVFIFENRPIQPPSSVAENSPPSSISVLFIMWVVFIQDQTFVIQETLATPIVQDTFEILKVDVVFMYTVAGVITFITVLFMAEYLTRCVSDFSLLFISCVLGFFGSVLCAQLPPPFIREHLFLCGFVLMIIVMPFGRGPLLSLYTKLITSPSQKGKYMGYLFTVSSFARIVAPIYATQSLQMNGPVFIWLVCAILFFVTICLLLFQSHLLSPEAYFELRPPKDSDLSKETLSVYEAF